MTTSQRNWRRPLTIGALASMLTVGGGSVYAVSPSQANEGADAEKEGYTLIFEDQFEGEQIDYEKWGHSPYWDDSGVYPRKDGYWADDEAFVDGEGHLIIQISERDGKYYSGAINTRDKFEHSYGYYEIRAKLPTEEGFWSAFWLMSDGVHDIGNEGRDGTEIDIFETPFASRGDDVFNHALHWDGYEEHHGSAAEFPQIPGIYEGFHTFGLDWNEDEYIFYVDGEETWRTSAGGVSQMPAFMQISAEVGQWAGNIANANLPDRLIVDYVRVYERTPDVESLLADARKLPAENYTLGSYYEFQLELNRIEREIEEGDYDARQIADDIADAIQSLVHVTEQMKKLEILEEMVTGSHAPHQSNPLLNPELSPDELAFHAFDDDTESFIDYETADNTWLQVDFGEGNEQVIDRIRAHTRNFYQERLEDAQFVGSNDGENWTLLSSFDSVKDGWNITTVENDTAYRYIRFLGAEGSYGNIAQIELYPQAATVTDRTLLNKQLDDGNQLEADGYGWSVLTEGLQAATSIYNDANATQEELIKLRQSFIGEWSEH